MLTRPMEYTVSTAGRGDLTAAAHTRMITHSPIIQVGVSERV